MFCQNCGKNLKDDAKFCDGCGKPTGQGSHSRVQHNEGYTAPQPFMNNTSVDPTQNAQYQKGVFKGHQKSIGSSGQIQFNQGKKKKGGFLKALGIVFLLLILGFFALAFFGGSSGIYDVATANNVDNISYEPLGKTNVFTVNSPAVYVTFKVDLPVGTTVASEWYYTTEDMYITEAFVQTTEEQQNVQFNLTRPNNGWPTGDYEVKLYIDGEYSTSATFSVQ